MGSLWGRGRISSISQRPSVTKRAPVQLSFTMWVIFHVFSVLIQCPILQERPLVHEPRDIMVCLIIAVPPSLSSSGSFSNMSSSWVGECGVQSLFSACCPKMGPKNLPNGRFGCCSFGCCSSKLLREGACCRKQCVPYSVLLYGHRNGNWLQNPFSSCLFHAKAEQIIVGPWYLGGDLFQNPTQILWIIYPWTVKSTALASQDS